MNEALSDWQGFVGLAPGEKSLGPNLLLAAGAPVDPVAFMADHTAVGQVGELGCHFLKNITFAGVLYPFIGDTFIDDGSHLAKVSLDWISQYPTHKPGMRGDLLPRVVDDPVISVAGPGHATYGHWILDFLPRLAIARETLGSEFRKLRFLVLSDIPGWALTLMYSLFGIREEDCIRFELGMDEFLCRKLCYPTFAHSYPFYLHSFLKKFYRLYKPVMFGSRRLCVVRRTNDGDGRIFERRATFEDMAVRQGYELVDPLGLSIWEQAALFGSASVLIGEYGSAMHNSVFSADGTVVGVLNAPGIEQSRLCAAFSQPIAYMPSAMPSGHWTLTDEQIGSFFSAVDDLVGATCLANDMSLKLIT